MLNHLETTPGASGPLAPPAGWTGTEDDYKALVRHRWDTAEGRGELLTAAAHTRTGEVHVSGPWAELGGYFVAWIASKFNDDGKDPKRVRVTATARGEG